MLLSITDAATATTVTAAAAPTATAVVPVAEAEAAPDQTFEITRNTRTICCIIKRANLIK